MRIGLYKRGEEAMTLAQEFEPVIIKQLQDNDAKALIDFFDKLWLEVALEKDDCVPHGTIDCRRCHQLYKITYPRVIT